MPILTESEINRIRASLGVYSANFTDGQLQAYYDAAYDDNASTPVSGAVAYAFYNLLTGAVSYTSYRQGETSETLGVIYDRLMGLYQMWFNSAGFVTALPTFAMKPLRLWYVDLPFDADPLPYE